MAAAKKPARKPAKPASRGSKKPVKKVVKKAAVKKAQATRTQKTKAAPPKRAPAKTAKPSKVVKAPAHSAKTAAQSKAAPPMPKRRGGRPARPRNEPRFLSPMPAPGLAAPSPMTAVAPRIAPAPSPKALAAAHEYLLARSATRSEEPVMVNGKRLPTEGELLKTSDSEYMNAQQLAYFKHRLQKMESELLENADQTTEHLRETVIVPDPADRATIEEEHALELRTRDRERKLLKKVQQALARIESGEYGYCEETGDQIGIPRLLARPTATLSLEAQQRRELKQKMFGD